jgi:hypothetical protein
VINNTIDSMVVASDAINVDAPSGTAQVTVNIFNNLLTRASQAGIALPDANAQLTVNSDFNDSFANGSADQFGGYPTGPSPFSVEPLYANAAAGDYRLLAGSPMIDAGTPSPPGGLPEADAVGNARVFGGAPDVGAYESTTTTPTTTTTLPADPCAPSATFGSVTCRLGALRDQAEDGTGDGRLSGKLGAALTKAKAAVQQAEGLTNQGKTKPARRALGKALGALRRFEKLIRAVPSPLRESLLQTATTIATDVETLQGRRPGPKRSGRPGSAPDARPSTPRL